MGWRALFSELEMAGDEKKAQEMRAYMRDKFAFLGIPAPQRRKICLPFFKAAKKEKKIAWDFVNRCWDQSPREYQYVAVDYLRTMERFLVFDDLHRVKQIILAKSWWDTVDGLSRVVGDLGLRYPKADQIMLEWSCAKDIWLRRTAIIHQLSRKERMNAVLLETILINNLNQAEFFINKAIGWILRDYSKTNPDWVCAFIEKNGKNMAALSIREGSKYLT